MNSELELAIPQPGDMLGSFRLERELGRGGMGTVFVARHTATGKRCAIKFMIPFRATADVLVHLVNRFKREIEALRRLQHPHIVRILDVGEDENGYPYYVMDLVDGESLEARLKAGRGLDEVAAAALADQVLEALGYAHSTGVVHRDLKPANVVLTPAPDGRFRATVIDFGVAKIIDPDITATEPGTLMGSALYMAPEQFRGDPDIDGRVDLYALGCMLSECLTKRPLLEARSLQHVTVQLMDPKPHLLDPSATESRLAPVIRGAVQKNRTDRFPSAAVMRDALAKTGLLSGGDSGVDITQTSTPSQTGMLATEPSIGLIPEAEARARARMVFFLVATMLLGVAVLLPFMVSQLLSEDPPQPPPRTTHEPIRAHLDSPGPALRTEALVPVAFTFTPSIVRVSPDGTQVAVIDSEGLALYTTSPTSERRPIEVGLSGGHTEDVSWMPDGQRLLLQWRESDADPAIYLVGLGGEPHVELGQGRGPAAAPDGVHYAYLEDGLFVRGVDGGGFRQLVSLEALGATPVGSPVWSPSGRVVALTVQSEGGSCQIVAVSALHSSTNVVAVGEDLCGPNPSLAWPASGAIIFARRDGLWAVNVDPDRGELTGSMVELVEAGADQLLSPSTARDGQVFYLRAGQTVSVLVALERL